MVAQPGPQAESNDGDKRREEYIGAYSTLESCLAGAEGRDQVEECLLDFDDSTGANRAEGSPLSVGPVALLGVGLLLAAGVQGVIPH